MDGTNKIVIFGRDNCQWCDKLKELLDFKGLEYEYHTLKTVPIAIVDGKFIGGYTDMEALLDDNV